MANLKTLCLLLVFSFIFTNCSVAQEKSPMELPTKVTESSDKVNPETKRFESKTGNFSINISQPPFQTQNMDEAKGQAPGKQFIWKFEKILYTILYTPVEQNDLATVFEQMNSGVRKGIGRQSAKLISEKEITYGKYPGREFTYVSQNGLKFVSRNYLIDKMGYQVVAGFADEQSGKEALEVLDSFKLITEDK